MAQARNNAVFENPPLSTANYTLKSIESTIKIFKTTQNQPTFEVKPDLIFYNENTNNILLLECKSGKYDGECSQHHNYSLACDEPNNIIKSIPSLGIKSNPKSEYAVLSLKEKDYYQSCKDSDFKLSCPILEVDNNSKLLIKNANSANFKEKNLDKTLNGSFSIKRESCIMIPFLIEDLEENLDSVIQTSILYWVSGALKKSKRGDKIPALDEIIKKEFPAFKLIDQGTSEILIKKISEGIYTILKAKFNSRDKDDNSLSKYISEKKGKIYFKKVTLKRLLEELPKLLPAKDTLPEENLRNTTQSKITNTPEFSTTSTEISFVQDYFNLIDKNQINKFLNTKESFKNTMPHYIIMLFWNKVLKKDIDVKSKWIQEDKSIL